MSIILIIVIISVLFIIWFVSGYNFFVSSKARIKAAVQEIGNQLKRQADLIPNLESSAKGYLKHEKEIYEKLTDARKSISKAIESGNVQSMVDAGEKISSLIPNLKVIIESNPELKSSEVVTKLMEELRDTSDKVMYARRLVIDLTADYNVKRATFPSNLIASIFGFSEQPGLITPGNEESLKVSEEEMKTPKVKLD